MEHNSYIKYIMLSEKRWQFIRTNLYMPTYVIPIDDVT